MVNKSGSVGTATETAVANAFRRCGFRARRLRLAGAKDVGDIDLGYDEVVLEVKGGSAAEKASDGQIAAWLLETETERANAGAQVGILIVKRKGIGYGNAHKWWAVCTMDTFMKLYACWPGEMFGERDGLAPVRVHLETMIRMLRAYVQQLDIPTATTDNGA